MYRNSPLGQRSASMANTLARLGSVNTLKSYIDYMENSWLLFTVKRYDFSVKRQQIAAKKVYAIDTGFANTVGFGFFPTTGNLLENLVFLALRRQTKDIYYYATPQISEGKSAIIENEVPINQNARTGRRRSTSCAGASERHRTWTRQ